MGRRGKKVRGAGQASRPVPVSSVVTVPDQPAAPCNQVVLVGRLAAPPEERTLPSGAVLVVWRVVVDRPPQEAPVGVRPVTVDTLDCAAWTPEVQEVVQAAEVGDVVRIDGALRRRFWRGAAGLASRYEVEAAAVTVVRRVAPDVAADRPQPPADDLRRPGGRGGPVPSAASA